MTRGEALELAAYPGLEVYTGNGWGPDQELGLIELGERVMEAETYWLFTWLYSSARDRHWAATAGMFGMVLDRIRRDRPEEELVLHALAGTDPNEVRPEEIPEGWRPDVEAWDEGRFNDRLSLAGAAAVRSKNRHDRQWRALVPFDRCAAHEIQPPAGNAVPPNSREMR